MSLHITRHRMASFALFLALALGAHAASAGVPMLLLPTVFGAFASAALIGGALCMRWMIAPSAPRSGMSGDSAKRGAGRPDSPQDACRGNDQPCAGPTSPGAGAQGAPRVRERTELQLEFDGNVGLRELLARVRVVGPGEVRLQRIEARESAGVRWVREAAHVRGGAPLCELGSVVSSSRPCVFLLGLGDDPHVGAFAPVSVTALHDARSLKARARAYVYNASFFYSPEAALLHQGPFGAISGAAVMLFDGARFQVRGVPGMPAANSIIGLHLSKDGRELYVHTKPPEFARVFTLERWSGQGSILAMSSRTPFRVYPTRRGACAFHGTNPYTPLRRFECFAPGQAPINMFQTTLSEPVPGTAGGLDLLWIRSLQLPFLPAEMGYFSDHWMPVELPPDHALHDLDPHHYAQTRSSDGVERYAFFGRFLDSQGRQYPAAMMSVLPRGVPGADRPRVERLDPFDFGPLRWPIDNWGTFIDGRRNTSLYMIAGDFQPPPGRCWRNYLLQSAVFEPVGFELVRKSRSEWCKPSPAVLGHGLRGMIGTTDDHEGTDFLLLLVPGHRHATHVVLIRVDRPGGLPPAVRSEPLFVFGGEARATRFVPMISNIPYPL